MTELNSRKRTLISRRSWLSKTSWLLAAITLNVFNVFALANLACAGAWVEEKGNANLYGSLGEKSWSHVFDSGGNRVSAPGETEYLLDVLGEYGLTDDLTLGAKPSLYSLHATSPGGQSLSGLSDIELLARERVKRWDTLVFSMQALLSIPGNYQDSSGQIVMGNVGVNAEIRALLGDTLSVGRATLFGDIELAYRKRFNGPNDEFRADLLLGTRPWPQWLAFFQLFNTYPIGSNPNPVTNYTLNEMALSVGREFLTRWTALITYTRQLAGKNALAGDGWAIGVWYRL